MKITLGNLVDQLTIANIRIWMAENIKRDPQSTDEEVAAAARITNTTNQLRNDLIQSIDEGLNEIAAGEKQKLYRQGAVKMHGKRS
jgi:Protein of unknown function (DUF4254)